MYVYENPNFSTFGKIPGLVHPSVSDLCPHNCCHIGLNKQHNTLCT